MNFELPLQKAVLIRRYKRFLADVKLNDGSITTIHCPNTGSMRNCQAADSSIWFTDSGNPKRKYPCTWQFIEVEDSTENSTENSTESSANNSAGKSIVGINTGLANKLVVEAIRGDIVQSLKGYQEMRTEVPYGEKRSRIDIYLSEHEKSLPACYVEVKNVSLGLGGGLGSFPDAVTSRGQKHLQELMSMKQQGFRALLFFCVQHTGINRVTPADDVDPKYGELLRQAAEQGVEILAYGVDIDLENSQISLQSQLEVLL